MFTRSKKQTIGGPSAVGEAFDNIALHGHSGSGRGNADLELEFHRDLLTIRLLDTGKGFDPSAEPLKLTKRHFKGVT